MNYTFIKKHKTALSVFTLVIFVLVSLLIFYFQQQLTKSQDLRQQASVTNGQVVVAALPIQPGQIELGKPSYIDLGIDTNNLQTNGVQLTFQLGGSSISDFKFEPISNPGFSDPLIDSSIGGNSGQVAFLPKNISGSFSSSTPTPFLRVYFTPTEPGNVQLTFDSQKSISTVYNSNPPQDELNTIEPITIAVIVPTPSPTLTSPSPVPSPSPTPIGTFLPTPLVTPSPSIVPSPSPIPIFTVPPRPSPSVRPRPTPSPTPPSITPSPTANIGPSPFPSPTPTPIVSSPPSSPIASAIPSPTPSPSAAVCANNPDITGDSKVGLADYSLLVSQFMQSGDTLSGDINCDGKVDIADYSILSDSFGFF